MSARSPTFGELLRQHLTRSGITQSELARRLHVHRATVSHWLTDNRTPDNKEVVSEIVRVISVDHEDDRTALYSAAGYRYNSSMNRKGNEANKAAEARCTSSQIEPLWRVPFLRNRCFVGRQRDLDDLHNALTDSNPHGTHSARPRYTIGLSGMGGIGKTQLAVEYCYRYKDSYPGGIFWLNAAVDWRREFADLGAYLEPDLAGEPEARRIRAAADYFKAHTDCLLVLDGVADPTQIHQPVVPELLPVDLVCHLLLTTRSRNLGDIGTIEVAVLPEKPAMQLLLRHETRQVVLAKEHPDHVEAQHICAIVGYLPLALEVAGAHLGKRPQVSLAVYRHELLARGALKIIDDPRGGVRDVDLGTRHTAGVEATLASQWATVEHDASRLLLRVAGQLPQATAIPATRLGLLAGVQTEGECIFGAALDRALDELNRLSLIETLRTGEVRLHPLVQEFARDRTDVVDTLAFRRACALNLLGAYHEVAELERQCAQRGIDALEADLSTAMHLLPITDDVQLYREMLQHFLRMVQHESHVLRGWHQAQQPTLFLQQWCKRALVSCDLQQAHAAASALAQMPLPHLLLQWTTAGESSALERTLSGHKDSVNAVVVMGDGQRAVSASADGTLKVWDLASGAELHTLNGHADLVLAVAVTGDGQRAVSASADGTLKVWDLATGVELHTLSGHTSLVVAVAVTGDGQRAVSASWDSTLKVWDLASGAELHTLSGHSFGVNAVAVTSDGQRAISPSVNELKVWDLTSGVELCTLSGHTSPVRAVVVIRDGQRAVSASADGTLRVWDLASGAELHTLSGHTSLVSAVVVTVDGQRAVSASDDHTLKVWDLASGAELHTLSGHTSPVLAVAVTGDGQRAVSASADGTLKVWDLARGAELRILGGHPSEVSSVAVTGDGQRAVSASADGTLKVWNLAGGAELHTLSARARSVSAVAVTGDGQRAVSASADGTLKVWDLASGAELHTLSGHASLVVAVVVTADGQRAVSASWDSTLKVWDLAKGAELHTLSGHRLGVRSVALTLGGQHAASASNDHTLKVWDLASGAELHTLSGHADLVLAVAVTGDGQRAVSASADGTLKVWDLVRGVELRTLSGHTGPVRALAVTFDGRACSLGVRRSHTQGVGPGEWC